MTTSSAELLHRGMKCLTEHMGIIEAERFIALISREKFDYTKWQQTYFADMTPEQISREAEECAKMHPYTGKAVRL